MDSTKIGRHDQGFHRDNETRSGIVQGKGDAIWILKRKGDTIGILQGQGDTTGVSTGTGELDQ